MDRLDASRAARTATMLAVGSVCALAVAPATVRATATRTGASVSVPAGTVIDDDLFAYGGQIRIYGDVDGDVTAGGNTIDDMGVVAGDLLAAGSSVSVYDYVGGSLRAAGGTVTVAGPVARNATIFAGALRVEPGGYIGRNAALIGGRVTVLAPVVRDLRITAGQAEVGTRIGGSVIVHANQFILDSGAVISGDLDVYSPRPPDLSPSARVRGNVRYHLTTSGSGDAQERPGGGAVTWLVGCLMRTAALFLLSLTAHFVWPRGFGSVAASLRRSAGRSLLYGAGALALLPVAVLALLGSVVGIPAGFTLLLAYGAAAVLAEAFVAERIGAWVSHRFLRRTVMPTRPYLRLLGGSAAVALLTMLPAIGWLFSLVFVLLGSGAIALTIAVQRRRRPAPEPELSNHA